MLLLIVIMLDITSPVLIYLTAGSLYFMTEFHPIPQGKARGAEWGFGVGGGGGGKCLVFVL